VGLTGKQRRRLRALAHRQKPLVQIGQRGLTNAVASQVDAALSDHELIKVRLLAEAPIGRREAADWLTERTGCEVAGTIGRVLILYRRHPEHPRIRLEDEAPEDDQAATNGPSTSSDDESI